MASAMATERPPASDSSYMTPQPQKLPLSNLDEAHLTPLTRALENVFATKVAEDTLAQLFDGLPLAQSYASAYGRPLLDARKQPISIRRSARDLWN